MNEENDQKAIEKFYPLRTDWLFKILFQKNPDMLKQLVAATLGIKSSSIKKLTVINSEIYTESMSGKFVRLDINMNIDGRIVDLEIQVLSDLSDKYCYPNNYVIQVDSAKPVIMAA
jgi:hypothetical protein